jgi:hypothetical protein
MKIETSEAFDLLRFSFEQSAALRPVCDASAGVVSSMVWFGVTALCVALAYHYGSSLPVAAPAPPAPAPALPAAPAPAAAAPARAAAS